MLGKHPCDRVRPLFSFFPGTFSWQGLVLALHGCHLTLPLAVSPCPAQLHHTPSPQLSAHMVSPAWTLTGQGLALRPLGLEGAWTSGSLAEERQGQGESGKDKSKCLWKSRPGTARKPLPPRVSCPS